MLHQPAPKELATIVTEQADSQKSPFARRSHRSRIRHLQTESACRHVRCGRGGPSPQQLGTASPRQREGHRISRRRNCDLNVILKILLDPDSYGAPVERRIECA